MDIKPTIIDCQIHKISAQSPDITELESALAKGLDDVSKKKVKPAKEVFSKLKQELTS